MFESIKPNGLYVFFKIPHLTYIKKWPSFRSRKNCQLIFGPPSSDMHVANTKPLPSSEATPGMLRPISKLPQAFKSIKHTSNKHTARATQYRAASWLRLFDIVWKESGVRKVTRPAERGDDGTRDNTYSHLMPEQTCDSSRALSTPRGRTGDLLLMVRQRFQFTQGVSTKEVFGRLNSRLSYHSRLFFKSWKRWHNDGAVQEYWIQVWEFVRLPKLSICKDRLKKYTYFQTHILKPREENKMSDKEYRVNFRSLVQERVRL